MKALSLRQPWGYAITHLGKRIENRTWKYLANLKLGDKELMPGDRVALHVSATPPKDYDTEGVLQASGARDLPDEAFQKGAIIATFQLAGILRTDEKQTIIEGTQDKPFPHYVMRPDDHQAFIKRYGDPGEARQLEQIRRWWMGPYAIVVDDVMVFPEPVTGIAGALGFWRIGDADLPRVQAQMAIATPAQEPDWFKHSLAIATAHDTVLKIGEVTIPVEIDPTMPPGQLKIKRGTSEQLVLFADPPKKERGGLH